MNETERLKFANTYDVWAKKLLDLSAGNRLLNFRPTKVGTVQITGPSLADLFEDMVLKDRGLKFPMLRSARATGTLSLFGAPDEEGPQAEELQPRVDPGDIETTKQPRDLERSLKRIEALARVGREERGINTLYLALGMLEWSPNESATLRQRAPLYLVPVELTREDKFKPYVLSAFDEDAEVNTTLGYLLSTQYNLTLPELPGDADTGSALETFLLEVWGLVASRGWTVQPEAWLGQFQFKKLTMFNDLQAHRELAEQHPIVPAIAGIGTLNDGGSVGQEETFDDVDPSEVFTVLDADSSQMRVLLRAHAGESIVVEGPPGTGKSQTITNLIAQLLYEGKRVLFVSEKMAALEVVRRRLEQVGLGPYCLEIHSDKAKKGEVIRQINGALRAAALHANSTPPAADQFQQLLHQRRSLNAYVRALHRPILGQLTPFKLQGDLAALHDAPNVIADLDVKRAEEEPGWERQVLDLLEHLSTHADVWANPEAHPWFGYRHPTHSLTLIADLETRLAAFDAALGEWEQVSETVAPIAGAAAPKRLVDAQPFLRLIAVLSKSPCPPASWFAEDHLDALKHQARGLRQDTAAYWESYRELAGWYQPAFFTLPAADLNRVLESDVARLRTFFGGGENWRETLWRQREAWSQDLADLLSALRAVRSTGTTIAATLGEPSPETLDDMTRLQRLSELLATNPRPLPSWLDWAELQQVRQRVEDSASATKELFSIRSDLAQRFRHSIFDLPAMEYREVVHRWWARTPFRLLSSIYRSMKRALEETTLAPAPLAHSEIELTVEKLAKAWTLQTGLRQQAETSRSDLGSHFDGERTDWPAVLSCLECTAEILRVFGRPLPEETIDLLLSGGPALQRLAVWGREIAQAKQEIDTAAGRLSRYTTLHIDPRSPLDQSITDSTELYRSLDAMYDAQQQVAALARPETARSADQLVVDCKALESLQSAAADIAAAVRRLVAEHGGNLLGLSTDWDEVLEQVLWIEAFLQACGPSGATPSLIQAATNATTIAELIRRLTAVDRAAAGVAELQNWIAENFEDGSFCPGTAGVEHLVAGVHSRIVAMRNASGQPHQWVEYRELCDQASFLGIAPFLSAARNQRLPASQLGRAVHRRLRALQHDEAYARVPELRQFSLGQHEQIIARFQSLDAELMRGHSRAIRRKVAATIPVVNAAAGGQARFLAHEMAKTRRYAPLRRLFREAGRLILDITPCLLMSPLSVATHLPKDSVEFDTVIFDEASQMPAEDAIGAVLRGKQLVVAGDTKQLPPTRFFEAMLDDGDEAAGDDEDEGTTATQPLESVLNDCRHFFGVQGPKGMLLWHYRSKHESLIAFSNAEFYENELITFSSPDVTVPDDVGVHWEYVQDGVYDRGRSRTNRREARRVAELVVGHMRRYGTGRSLGVIALSSAQQEAIEAALEAHPEFSALADTVKDGDEPFFVKPLEHVQGDERDAIILSIGYGKAADGIFRLNLGPLNQDGGERRLNVAVTRSRQQVTIVSSIGAEDIDEAATTKRGPVLLKRYLQFAADGKLPPATTAPLEDVESEFERAVWDAVTAQGFQVDRQVGCSGYRIDLAVKDPKKPGRYLLGIECDGAMYHRSKVARDRDRLRQQHLESLGWRIHRVWSTDWIRDRTGALGRVLEQIRQAQMAPDEVELPPVEAVAVSPLDQDDTAIAASESVVGPADGSPSEKDPYLMFVAEYREATLPARTRHEWEVGNRIMDDLAEVVRQEGPIHWERALEAVPRAYGLGRSGRLIQQKLDLARQRTLQRGLIVQRGSFLWPSSEPNLRPRRSTPGTPSSKIAHVAPEEIDRAVSVAVQVSGGMRRDEIPAAAGNVLGYGRTGGDIRTALLEAVDRLLAGGTLVESGDVLRVAGT